MMNVFAQISRVVVPAAVLIAFAYFRKRVPVRTLSERELAELDRRFQPYRYIPTVCMVLIGVLFAFATHALFVWINRVLAYTSEAGSVTLLPQTAIWWFFPGFGALACSWELTIQLWSLLGYRETAESYAEWANVRSWGANGMDSRRVLQVLMILVALPIGFFTALALPMHATVGNEIVKDCGYAFKPCTVYRLSEARRVTSVEGFRTRDGKITHRAGLVVDFSNGQRWSSEDWGNFHQSVDPLLFSTVRKGTGLTIGSAETAADISAAENYP